MPSWSAWKRNRYQALLNDRLLRSVETGLHREVRYWIARGANPNAAPRGERPLLICCAHFDIECLMILLQAKPELEHADAEGLTALMMMASSGNELGVAALLASGANPNASSGSCGHGLSPVLLASNSLNPDALRLLLESGGDPEGAPGASQTPLVAASYAGSWQNVRSLLSAGAHVNAPTPSGETPLMAATAAGHNALVLDLLAYGADPRSVDCEGSNASDIAESNGYDELISPLRLAALSWSERSEIEALLPSSPPSKSGSALRM